MSELLQLLPDELLDASEELIVWLPIYGVDARATLVMYDGEGRVLTGAEFGSEEEALVVVGEWQKFKAGPRG